MNQTKKSVLIPWEKYQRLLKQMLPSNSNVQTTKNTLEQDLEPEDVLSLGAIVQSAPKMLIQKLILF